MIIKSSCCRVPAVFPVVPVWSSSSSTALKTFNCLDLLDKFPPLISIISHSFPSSELTFVSNSPQDYWSISFLPALLDCPGNFFLPFVLRTRHNQHTCPYYTLFTISGFWYKSSSSLFVLTQVPINIYLYKHSCQGVHHLLKVSSFFFPILHALKS